MITQNKYLKEVYNAEYTLPIPRITIDGILPCILFSVFRKRRPSTPRRLAYNIKYNISQTYKLEGIFN